MTNYTVDKRDVGNFLNRFFGKVRKTKTCWFWKAFAHPSGHGMFRHKDRMVYAHRISFVFHKGEPKNLVLHKCNKPSCVNPDHLYDGTRSQNGLDSVKAGTHFEAAKTHCKRGHPFSKENTYKYENHRTCRKCWKASMSKVYAKRRKTLVESAK